MTLQTKKKSDFSSRTLGLIGILTGLQRTRIRVTYGIKGSIGNDLALSFFCRPCTLMQNDREVRAREGDQKLRTNKKACPKAAPITTQPSPVQEMRYISPRQTVSDNESLRDCGDGTEPRDSLPTSKKLLKLPKHQPRLEKAHHPPQPDQYHLVMSQAKTRAPSPLKSKSGNTSGASPSSSSHDPISPRSSKAPKNENKPVVGTSDPIHHSSHTEDKRKVRSTPASPTTHGLADCFPKVPPKGTGSTTGKQTQSQQHALASCSGIKAEESNSSTHIVSESTKVEELKEGAKTSEHTIMGCQTVALAAKKEATNTTDTHELSYVHDFSECQIDKNILDYYEKEEIRSQLPNSLHQHASGMVMPSRAKSTSTEQHAIVDCTREDASSVDKSTKDNATSPEQHALADCAREDAGNKDKSPSPKHHALAECTKEDASRATKVKSTTPEQHALVDCARDSFSNGPQSATPKQHALASCHEERVTPGTPGRQSRRASTPAHSPTNKHPQERQHRLASCPVPSFNQKEERAPIPQQMTENARINESGNSQSTVKPSSQHALSKCAGDANSEHKVPTIDGRSQNEKRVSLGLKIDDPVKDKDVADHPRKSRYRKEVEFNANFSDAKRTSHAHNALSQVLAGSAHKKESSQKGHAGHGVEAVSRVFGGSTEQEKGKGKAGSQEDLKSSGFASMFSKITSPKTKTKE
jgi:hypothetical protein